MATKSSKIDCHQCGKSINHTDGRGHASEHILLKLAGLKEQGLREEVRIPFYIPQYTHFNIVLNP